MLKEKITSVINTVLGKEITHDELNNVIELTSEYGLKIQDIVTDSFDGKVVREIKKLIEEIDKLFKAYDEWQSNQQP
jgi:hypothetical protein